LEHDDVSTFQPRAVVNQNDFAAPRRPANPADNVAVLVACGDDLAAVLAVDDSLRQAASQLDNFHVPGSVKETLVVLRFNAFDDELATDVDDDPVAAALDNFATVAVAPTLGLVAVPVPVLASFGVVLFLGAFLGRGLLAFRLLVRLRRSALLPQLAAQLADLVGLLLVALSLELLLHRGFTLRRSAGLGLRCWLLGGRRLFSRRPALLLTLLASALTFCAPSCSILGGRLFSGGRRFRSRRSFRSRSFSRGGRLGGRLRSPAASRLFLCRRLSCRLCGRRRLFSSGSLGCGWFFRCGLLGGPAASARLLRGRLLGLGSSRLLGLGSCWLLSLGRLFLGRLGILLQLLLAPARPPLGTGWGCFLSAGLRGGLLSG
jgi:hypothetical protein